MCSLDVGLPDCNGFELLKEIRHNARAERNIPVIILTARSEEVDRAIGLEIGAEDYVCKRFSPREMVARVNVIVKRVSLNRNSASITKGNLNDSGAQSHPPLATHKGAPLQQNQDNFTHN
ncbi:MAG: two-component system OmpR family response regulator [Saprospiraceae bacterium]